MDCPKRRVEVRTVEEFNEAGKEKHVVVDLMAKTKEDLEAELLYELSKEVLE